MKNRHKNQNKKLKKWRYVYHKFGITQRFNNTLKCQCLLAETSVFFSSLENLNNDQS